MYYNASHTPGSGGATFDISAKFDHLLKSGAASERCFRLRLEVFQATGTLRKVFIDGTVAPVADGGVDDDESEVSDGSDGRGGRERVVLFWILIPGSIIVSAAAVALVGICYRYALTDAVFKTRPGS